MIGFEERRDDALPVSTGTVCVDVDVQLMPQQIVKQLKSVERSIVRGRLASGNCFYAPLPPSIVYITNSQ